MYIHKHTDCLSSLDVKNRLYNIYKDFLIALIDKATGNNALVCKRFYASVIAEELRLKKIYREAYIKISNLPAHGVIDKGIIHLKIIFGVDNVPIKNC